MAATRVTVNATPTAISGLTDDTGYQAQVEGLPLFYLAASSTPTRADGGFWVGTHDGFWFHKVSGEEIYVWAAGEDTSLWYDEVPS